MARILLVPSINIYRQRIDPYVPYGLLALQAVSSKYKTQVDILSLPEGFRQADLQSSDDLCEFLFSAIDIASYDVVGFSTVTNSFYHTLVFSRYVRSKSPDCKIIYGGPFVTKLSRQVLSEFDCVDAIFVGESEISFGDFLARCDNGGISFGGIPGVHTRQEHECAGPIIDDLDQLPFITEARDFVHWFNVCQVGSSADRSIPLETTRGCPLQCSFCSTRQVWGARVRRKSPTRLLAEMELLSNRCGQTFFNLIGDNVGVPRAHFMAFCEQFREINKGFTWGCSLKLDRLEANHLKQMWDAGGRAMFIGVESGNQKTLDSVRKKTNVRQELENIRTAIRLGFKVDTSFIIGFPWETLDDIKQTYLLHCELLKSGAHRSQVGILCPIPGTDIVRDAEIKFDLWSSYIAEDDIPPNDELKAYTNSLPSLFSHLGHYDTPHVSRIEIKAVRDAAARINGLYEKRQTAPWNVF